MSANRIDKNCLDILKFVLCLIDAYIIYYFKSQQLFSFKQK